MLFEVYRDCVYDVISNVKAFQEEDELFRINHSRGLETEFLSQNYV